MTTTAPEQTEGSTVPDALLAAVRLQQEHAERMAAAVIAVNTKAAQALAVTAQALAPVQRLSEQLQAASAHLAKIGPWIDREAAADVAALLSKTRSLAHGNDFLAVEITRLMAQAAQHSVITASTVAWAIEGRPDAVDYFTEKALTGDPLALQVLYVLSRLAYVEAAAEEVLCEVAALIAALTVPDALPIPSASPPRKKLAGSLDRCAP